MKLKIVSDGTMDGTAIIDADTGEPVEDVIAVEFKHEAGEEPVAVIRVRRIMFDAHAAIERLTD